MRHPLLRALLTVLAVGLTAWLVGWLTAYYVAVIAVGLWVVNLVIALARSSGPDAVVVEWRQDADWRRVIFERRPERLVLLVGLFVVALLMLRPAQIRRWVDYYEPYTGVVLRRGTDLPFFGSVGWDYVVIRTPDGRVEKRYGTVWRYTTGNTDSTIEVGDSIVKERGFAHLAHAVHPASTGR